MTAPVTHGSWVTWVMGQELNGSLGSWVTLIDPFPALPAAAVVQSRLHEPCSVYYFASFYVGQKVARSFAADPSYVTDDYYM